MIRPKYMQLYMDARYKAENPQIDVDIVPIYRDGKTILKWSFGRKEFQIEESRILPLGLKYIVPLPVTGKIAFILRETTPYDKLTDESKQELRKHVKG